MKNLNEYIEESLLDDEDELIQQSDIVANKKNSIGEFYKVRAMEDWGILKDINKSKLKKYPNYWEEVDNSGVKIEYVDPKQLGVNFRSADHDVSDMINILLSFSSEYLITGKYSQSNKILSFFKDIFNIEVVKGYKSKTNGEIELFLYKDRQELYIWLSKKKN